LYNPRGARVDGRAMVAAVEHAARALGVDWRVGEDARIAVDHGRVRGVETASATLSCGTVVIAGGAWTTDVARVFGMRTGVRPVRGQIVHLRLDADTSEWPVLQPIRSHYVVPWPEGRLALGATVEDVGFDARPTASGLRLLFSEGLRLCPGLGDATFLEVRVGLRPTSDDDLPLIGVLPGVEGVVVASGHGANGLLLGPVTGRVVADVVSGRTPPVDIGDFAPARFG
jgi:D-amino-acid dehydrogenase